MSHQVVITFDMDENKIQANAEKEAGRQIAKDLITQAFGSGYSIERNAKAYIQEAIKEILLQENKDKIIEQAIKEVTDSLKRTKAVKEKLAETLNE